jgi:hypothetical protein
MKFGLKLFSLLSAPLLVRAKVCIGALHEDLSSVALPHAYCPWSYKVTV